MNEKNKPGDLMNSENGFETHKNQNAWDVKRACKSNWNFYGEQFFFSVAAFDSLCTSLFLAVTPAPAASRPELVVRRFDVVNDCVFGWSFELTHPPFQIE